MNPEQRCGESRLRLNCECGTKETGGGKDEISAFHVARVVLLGNEQADKVIYGVPADLANGKKKTRQRIFHYIGLATLLPGYPMKRLLCISMLAIACGTMAAAQVQIEKGSAMCWKKRRASEPPVMYNAPNGGPAHAYDVQNYTLTLDIYNCFRSPFPASYRGYEVVTLRVDSALSSITLNAINGSLVIDSVKLAATAFAHSGDLLTLTLDRTYAPAETVDAGIFFRHKNVQDNAFYTSSDSLVFTDCEPQGARYWFPCWDAPADKATWDLTALVPSSVRRPNGRLADSTTVNDTTTYHWVSRDPVATYLMVLTAKSGYRLDIVTGRDSPIQRRRFPSGSTGMQERTVTSLGTHRIHHYSDDNPLFAAVR